MQEVETKLGAVKRVFLEARGETGGDGTKLKACSPCCVRLSARYSASVGGGGSSMRWGGWAFHAVSSLRVDWADARRPLGGTKETRASRVSLDEAPASHVQIHI
jgi:hypothetical protein